MSCPTTFGINTIVDNNVNDKSVDDNSIDNTVNDKSTPPSENCDTARLVKLGWKYIDAANLQRQRAYNYYLKVKDNADYKEKLKLESMNVILTIKSC